MGLIMESCLLRVSQNFFSSAFSILCLADGGFLRAVKVHDHIEKYM
jgi:hypothetical protein